MTTRHDELLLAAQKRIIERLNRIEKIFDRLFDNLDDIKDATNRHDQTLYEFLVKPARDEEDKNEQLGKMIYSGQLSERNKNGK